MIIKALQFAQEMHKGQVRKYTGEDYVDHPVAVADLVELYLDEKGYSDEEIMSAIVVAILHDTVEDTPATLEDIETIFGEEVVKGVWFLTKVPNYVGNRATRKKMCEARLAEAPEVIRIIKTFDMIHNHYSIEEHDPKFFETFQKETKSLLKAMKTEYIWEEKA
tara:strand:- start:630 stop:1121 length:492 start_codon:yes stop_codon:yes gene_type:complete